MKINPKLKVLLNSKQPLLNKLNQPIASYVDSIENCEKIAKYLIYYREKNTQGPNEDTIFAIKQFFENNEVSNHLTKLKKSFAFTLVTHLLWYLPDAQRETYIMAILYISIAGKNWDFLSKKRGHSSETATRSQVNQAIEKIELWTDKLLDPKIKQKKEKTNECVRSI
ncbi:hypothetical protein [Candidatus Uabimicrobium sp. HlEnr_7]|uniref:hypothetical protein n=1 Tax=Candidatus Uabimicrobium helgolandensis TaxID=3095367 RepID=UPI00355851FA